MRGYVWLILLVGFLAFTVYAYTWRTNYRIDERDEIVELGKQINGLRYDVETLSYVISIFPKELKNEVLFNSVKEKFPDIEKRANLLSLIKFEKEEKKEGEEEKEKVKSEDEKTKTSPTVAGMTNSVIADFSN